MPPAQQALSADLSNAPIEIAIDLVPAPAYLVTSEGTLVYVNTAFLSLLGHQTDEVVGFPVTNFVDESLTYADHRSEAHEADKGVVCDVRAKDGRRIAVSVRTRPLPAQSAEGSALRFCILTELTNDDQLTAQLRLKAFRLQSCLEGTAAATWEWNVQTGQTVFNERWAELIGYQLSELGETTIDTWMSFAHADDLAVSVAALQRHFAGETPFYDIEARMRHKNGQWIWVRDRGRVFTWTEDGKPEWMFGTHISIETEKTKDSNLQLSAQLLEQIGQVAGVGGWRLDLDTEELLWTSATKRIHGVAPDFVPTLETAIGFYAPEAQTAIQQAVEQGVKDKTPWDLELPLVRADGARIWVRAGGQAEVTAGKPKYLYGAFQDVTAQVHRRNALNEMRRWLDVASQNGGIGLWSTTVGGHVTWNAHMTHLFGVRPVMQPVTFDAWVALLDKVQGQKLRDEVAAVLSGKPELRLEFSLQSADGGLRRIRLQGLRQNAEEEEAILIGSCFDVTEGFVLANALEAQQIKLETILNSIADAVLVTDRDGVVDWMNPTAEQLLDLSQGEARGLRAASLFQLEQDKTHKPIPHPIDTVLRLKAVPEPITGHLLVTRHGKTLPVADSVAPIFDSNDELSGAVYLFRDASYERTIALETEYRAEHDALTGLLNRASFERAACTTAPIPMKETRQSLAALLFLDIDRFKSINDQHGHLTGDRVLREVAQTLRANMRQFDLVGRIGGDEFLIMLTKLETPVDVASAARRIRKAVGEITVAGDPVACSIGAAIVRLGEDYKTLLHRADQLMYRAKHERKTGIEIDAP
jgi:diguanylate cyclase (GGDEF)-like protein/PAS domain S-box-containing protein